MNNKNLKVSILVANYNNQYYLEECINSIKNQTYKNIEVIFHDDLSTDESLKKVSNFKDLKIIKNKTRGKFGSYNQINAYQRAFNKSTGEIIFFLDSDDFFKKDKVKSIVNIFLKDNQILSVFDLPIIKYKTKIKFAKNKKKLIDNYWPYIPPQSCISIRRKHFKTVMNKVNFNLFPDIWMDFRMAIYLKYISKKFFVLNKNLTFYRQSPEMVSSNFKFLSKSWFKRRMQAHNYVKFFLLKNKINYKKNSDYFITSFINFFI